MFKRFLLSLFLLLPFHSSIAKADAVYWTVTPTGIIATSGGKVAIQHSTTGATSPNPAGTPWTECKSRLILLNKNASGSVVDDRFLDRMLTIALAAQKTGSRLRLRIDRDQNNNCFSNQVYDMGL